MIGGALATRRGVSGFTLLETIVALGLLSVVGYALALVAGAGQQSQHTVLSVAAFDRDLRAATSKLVDELSSSSDSRISVTTLADGNQAVSCLLPIQVAGADEWGVCDRSAGGSPSAASHAGWSVRYTVQSATDASGAVDKRLVRQVLNAALAVQRSWVLVHGLRSGGTPGFTVVKTGAVWVVTIATVGDEDERAGTRTVLHVRTRN